MNSKSKTVFKSFIVVVTALFIASIGYAGGGQGPRPYTQQPSNDFTFDSIERTDNGNTSILIGPRKKVGERYLRIQSTHFEIPFSLGARQRGGIYTDTAPYTAICSSLNSRYITGVFDSATANEEIVQLDQFGQLIRIVRAGSQQGNEANTPDVISSLICRKSN